MKITRCIVSLLLVLMGCQTHTASAQLWASTSNPDYSGFAKKIATDAQSNVYTLQAGGIAYWFGNVESGILTKYRADGSLQWQKYLQSAELPDTRVNDMTADEAGNTFVCGTVYFANQLQYFVAKYNSNGDAAWSRMIPGVRTSTGQGLKLKRSVNGDLYASGILAASPIDNLEERAFVAKYNNAGDLLWKREYAPSVPFYSLELYTETDPQGNVFMVVPLAELNTVLRKYSATGEFLWERALGFDVRTNEHGFAIDANGRCFVAGTYQRNDGPTSTAWRAVLFDAQGATSWTLAGENEPYLDQYPTVAHFDREQNLILSLLGPGTRVRKYSPEGTQLWETHYSTPLQLGGRNEFRKIWTDAANNLYLAGKNNPTAPFPANIGPSKGIVVRISPSGTVEWNSRYAEPAGDYFDYTDAVPDVQGNPLLLLAHDTPFGTQLYLHTTVVKMDLQTRLFALPVPRINSSINYTVVDADTAETIFTGVGYATHGPMYVEHLPPGNYRIRVRAGGFTQGVFYIDTRNAEALGVGGLYIAGDIDGDNLVDINDLALMVKCYNQTSQQPRYNFNADFDGSGVNDINDLRALLFNYRRKGEPF